MQKSCCPKIKLFPDVLFIWWCHLTVTSRVIFNVPRGLAHWATCTQKRTGPTTHSIFSPAGFTASLTISSIGIHYLSTPYCLLCWLSLTVQTDPHSLCVFDAILLRKYSCSHSWQYAILSSKCTYVQNINSFPHKKMHKKNKALCTFFDGKRVIKSPQGFLPGGLFCWFYLALLSSVAGAVSGAGAGTLSAFAGVLALLLLLALGLLSALGAGAGAGLGAL